MDMSRDEYLARCRRAKENLARRGESVNEWALRRGFSPQIVYAVLNGRCFGTKGEAHRVAVALNIKDDNLGGVAI